MSTKTQTDNLYDSRHKMQKAYNQLTKQHWVTLLICLFAGWTGAHRFYLGDNKVGALILVFALTRLTIEWVNEYFPNEFLGDLSYFGLFVLLAVVVVVLFLATSNEGYDLL